jgi:hypothetical protein
VTDGRAPGPEERFFEGGTAAPAGPPAPPRRESPLLARSPAVAALVLALCGWLLWDLAPDVAWFFAPRAPVDLGGPGALRLDRARENRLAQLRGELAGAVTATESRSGAERRVGLVAGTGVVVDVPGRAGPPVYEGRLLPAARARADYAEAVALLRARGADVPDGWLVLRDGERPGRRPAPVIGAALLVLLAAVNLRALAKRLSLR